MHPKAREARLKDYEMHPDKNPDVAEKTELWCMYKINPLNMIKAGDKIEFISPDVVATKADPSEWKLVNPEDGTIRSWVCDGHECVLYTKIPLQSGALIRIEDPDYVSGIIRDSGR